MNDLITVTTEEKAAAHMSLGLQSRLLYLLLKCPLLQREGQNCTCTGTSEKGVGVSVRGRRVHADDEEVILQVTVPYALRRAAGAAHLDCNELMRKALAKRLKKAEQK